MNYYVRFVEGLDGVSTFQVWAGHTFMCDCRRGLLDALNIVRALEAYPRDNGIAEYYDDKDRQRRWLEEALAEERNGIKVHTRQRRTDLGRMLELARNTGD